MATILYAKTTGNHENLLDIIQTAVDYQASQIFLQSSSDFTQISEFLQERFGTYLIPALADTDEEFKETPALKRSTSNFDWDSINEDWAGIYNSIIRKSKAVELSKAM